METLLSNGGMARAPLRAEVMLSYSPIGSLAALLCFLIAPF